MNPKSWINMIFNIWITELLSFFLFPILDDISKAVYFYGPMGVTVVCNIILFISTALKILQHKRDTATQLKGSDSRRHDDHKQWFVNFNYFLNLGFIRFQIKTIVHALLYYSILFIMQYLALQSDNLSDCSLEVLTFMECLCVKICIFGSKNI